MTPFQELIVRYAGDRQICNCGNAYYSPVGEAIVNGEWVHDHPVCENGCSANQIASRDHVAKCALEELNV